MRGATRQSFSGWEPKRLWRQLEGGRFEECSFPEGFDSRVDGRALVAADLDNDGDQDLLMQDREGQLQLFRNDGPVGGALQLSLRATGGNRDAAGAVVRVGQRAFPVLLARGYTSAVDPRIHAGLGREPASPVSVEWRPGKAEDFGRLEAGFRYELVEGQGRPAARTPFAPPSTAPELRFPARFESLGFPPGEGPVVVQIFAGWCKPCAQEVPQLNALAKGGAVRVLGLGADPAAQVEAVRKRLSIAYPVLPLTDALDRALSVSGPLRLPAVLVYDRSGALLRVVHTPAALEAALAELAHGESPASPPP